MKAERKAVKEWLRTMDRGEYERMLRDALFTELYPVRQKSGHNLYATQIRTRRNYVLHVAADSSTFTLVHGCLNNCNCGAVASLS